MDDAGRCSLWGVRSNSGSDCATRTAGGHYASSCVVRPEAGLGEPIVVEVERSGFVESVHLVDVAVVDATGRLVAGAGDPNRSAAFRSCAKPIQARVCLENGWVADPPSTAVACASHNGEPGHVERVRAILARAGIREEELRCPAALPALPDAALVAGGPSSVYNYCSGKHAAMLATCVRNGWPLESYREPDHPLQRLVRDRVEALTGGIERVLVDGCGVPTFVASLVGFARAFRAIDDGGPEAAAMREHPFLVAGTGELDTDLMGAAPHVLTKYGAEGLQCASANGYGIALKARDGALSRAREPAMLLVLHQLGAIDDAVLAKLAQHAGPPVLGGGVPVGRVRASGRLEPR